MIKIADFGLSKSLAQNEQAAKSQQALSIPQGGGDEDWGEEDGMEEHQTERCGPLQGPRSPENTRP